MSLIYSQDSVEVVESKTDIIAEYVKVSSFYALGINTPSFFLSKNITPKVKPENKSNMLFSFFTTSCVPCKKEIPFIQKYAAEYGIEKAYLINIGDKKEMVQKYLDIYKTDMKVLHDPYGTVSKKLGVESTPSLFVISGDGDLLYRHDGFNDQDTTELQQVFDRFFTKDIK